MDAKKTEALAKTINLGAKDATPADDNAPEIKPGSILHGRYEVQRKLGEGGMGVVYQGFDRQLQQSVAIKLLKRSMSQNDAAIGRMKEEAQVAMMLSHPNIMRLINFERHEDYAYLLLEFVNGKTLEDLAFEQPEGRFDSVELAQITLGILDALKYAHENGVVHRDIKPANIMICDQGVVKLMDFGIAKILTGDEGSKNTISGTLAYIAPEIFEGVRPDPRADIYALGLTLYELLAGRHPFELKGQSTLQIIEQHFKFNPPPLEDVDRQLMTIVRTAIEKRPNARYQSAQSMHNSVKRMLNLDEKTAVERMKRKMEYERRQLEKERELLEEEKRRLAKGGAPRAMRPVTGSAPGGPAGRPGVRARRPGAKPIKKSSFFGLGQFKENEDFETPPLSEIAPAIGVAAGGGLLAALGKLVVDGDAGFVNLFGLIVALGAGCLIAGAPHVTSGETKNGSISAGISCFFGLFFFVTFSPYAHFALDEHLWAKYDFYVYLMIFLPVAFGASFYKIRKRTFNTSLKIFGALFIIALIASAINFLGVRSAIPALGEFFDFILMPRVAAIIWAVVQILERNIQEW